MSGAVPPGQRRSGWAWGISLGVIEVVFTVMTSGPTRPALAAPINPTDRFFLGVGVQGRTFETMSFSDIRPLTRGEFGGRADVGLRVAGPWWTVIAGHFGGAWFDFTGPGVSGKVEDFSWLIRGGLDRHGTIGGGTTLYFGLGAEYGETRSWLDTYAMSDEGPHVYLDGGYLKAGVMRHIIGPVQAYIEIISSTYRAHARQARPQNNFDWLGRSLESGAGLRLVLGPG